MTKYKGLFWFEWLFFATLSMAIGLVGSNAKTISIAFDTLEEPVVVDAVSRSSEKPLDINLFAPLNAAERPHSDPPQEVSHELLAAIDPAPQPAAAPVVTLPVEVIHAPKPKPKAAPIKKTTPTAKRSAPDRVSVTEPDFDQLAERLYARYCRAQSTDTDCTPG